jgi:hypothetical protein
MSVKPGFVIGFAAGYVLGARAGRERYEQIRQGWARLTGSPAVRRATERTRDLAAVGARRTVVLARHGVERAGAAVRERLHQGDGFARRG